MRAIYFYGKFAMHTITSVLLLLLWHTFFALVFGLALLFNAISYPVWWLILALRALHREYEYRRPFKETWREEYYLGDPYNPENTFRKNASFFFIEVTNNVGWNIKNSYEECRKRAREPITLTC